MTAREPIIKKKTPTDVSDFELSQLYFFLEQGNVAETLAEFNPSLAWLAEIAKLDVLKSSAELAPWIGQNFNDLDAIREVVRNINFFDERAAQQLEWVLNQKQDGLDPILADSWRLIIRHIRTVPRGGLRDEWFDIEPRLKAGDYSYDLLDRLVALLRPRLRVGKRFTLFDEDDLKNVPETPSDLMVIEYEMAENISETEVLSAWPENISAGTERRFLTSLDGALEATLNDAIQHKVENNTGYSITDSDVPSVAAHSQNNYRTGFLPIVRMIAEIWSRLAHKDAKLAIPFVVDWSTSPLKMVNRLALFAAADSAVPPSLAATVLLNLPLKLLFLTNSSVEVFRLIRVRWTEMPETERVKIEKRIVSGPTKEWFHSNAERNVDRSRFEILGYMDRAGMELGDTARTALEEIRKRFPQWELRPAEQAGFHIWSGDVQQIVGDPLKLQNTPAEALVDEAKRLAKNADFMDGDDWQALCQSDPQHALRGLENEARNSKWLVWAWKTFLWASQSLNDQKSIICVSQLLLNFPDEDFLEIADSVSWWLEKKAKSLDDDILWPLWDKVVSATMDETSEVDSNDVLISAINNPAGRLVELLLTKIKTGDTGQELPGDMRHRFDKLVSAPGSFGQLARVCFASHVAYLFGRIPIWTTESIIPLFDWNSPEALDAWKARKYSSNIGSPKLFELTKAPFLELFNRSDVSEDELDVYGTWITSIIIANQSSNAGYPLTSAEARSALRKAGTRVLPSIGHRLAIEMQSAGMGEKTAKWVDVVGPAFRSIWPLDAELQSPSAAFKLVQILLATGSAFSDAADVIIPFIRPEGPHEHTTLYSISKADDVLYSSSPEKMLDLVAAVVSDEPSGNVYGLRKILERIRSHAPQLANTRKYQRFLGVAG